MTRLIFALSLAFLLGLFLIPGIIPTAYGFNDSNDQAQSIASGSFQTVAWHRIHRDYWVENDFDGPVVTRYWDETPIVRDRVIEETPVVRDRDVIVRDRDRVVEEAPIVTERVIETPIVRERVVEEPPVYYYDPGFSLGIPFFYFHLG